jgi:quercetin dioxygenase-like cupin family protein
VPDTHDTTGTNLREAHALSGQGLTYSLDDERRELENELGRTTAGRTAKTLAKAETLRVTLVHVREGTTIHPSAAAGAASVQVLHGRLSVEVDDTPLDLGPGALAIFSNNLQEPLRAVEDSTFLVTVAWEEGAGAWDQEEQEGQH